ncbi:putative inorganic carbon transporter subunit DabA [Dyadobacter sp. BHUBP1]|uniref:putative inorganic carbon transporter subunit DabA n=1 Tax=Dyadobacter sp. BHUBP1 TaxID=3424178 RepID=UPI003D359A7D
MASAPTGRQKDFVKRYQFLHMTARNNSFDEHAVLHELKRFLPALSPGRVLTHRNPLGAFQGLHFHDALRHASEMLGYQTWLSLEEYRSLYNSKRVKADVLEKVLVEKKGDAKTFEWQNKILMKKFPVASETVDTTPRIGRLRANWQKQYNADLDALVHPRLFRILGSFLDHGVSDWSFPVHGQGFLDSMREVESNSFISAFNTPRARKLLLQTPSISDLLAIIVGEEALFKQYLFDQQFAHKGWSGLVATFENSHNRLPNGGHITLRELIVFELLLEIDVLDDRLGKHWKPLASHLASQPTDLFAPVPASEKSEVLAIWQEAVEWSYYEDILTGLCRKSPNQHSGHVSGTGRISVPNSLCIIGRLSVARDTPPGYRACLDSYDFSLDRDGQELERILETVVPSLGADNLEYFFSRTGATGMNADNALSDRIIGLFGMADGARGDLRIGLPSELIEGLEPIRLLCIVEHFHETVVKVIDRLNAVHSPKPAAQWIMNEWVHLVVIDPVTRELRVLKNGQMTGYKSDPLKYSLSVAGDW